MSDMLRVSEYGSIYRGNENRNRESGDLELTSSDFDEVLMFLEEFEELDLRSAFRYFRHRGVDCLKAQNYVGVIRTESQCQFEILPKVSKTMSVDSAQNLLIKMLVELRGGPFKKGATADLQAHTMSFLETFLRYFLDQVANIVRQGIARSYVSIKDNLVYLRGKLQLTEHLKHNIFQKTLFFCEFDEYEANRPINRLIKRALEVVLRESRDPGNIQHCRDLLLWFDRVPTSTDVDHDFRSLRRDRLVQHYAPAMPSCKLILQGLNPLTHVGENRTIALLFDMNVVFQDYVIAKLSGQFPDYLMSAQAEGYYLVEKFKQDPTFGLTPDIELRHRRTGFRVIGDCKWKLLGVKPRDQQISNKDDMYQIFAYCKKCLVSQEYRCVLLIYPKTDRFHTPQGPYYFDKKKRETLYVLPFDLENDLLITDSIDMFEPRVLGRAA